MQSQAEMPEKLRAILNEPGWRANDDGDLFLWEIKTADGDPAIRVALEDGDWWVTCEMDGYTIADLDTMFALLICMTRVHQAIGTPLGHFAVSFDSLAAIAREATNAIAD